MLAVYERVPCEDLESVCTIDFLKIGGAPLFFSSFFLFTFSYKTADKKRGLGRLSLSPLLSSRPPSIIIPSPAFPFRVYIVYLLYILYIPTPRATKLTERCSNSIPSIYWSKIDRIPSSCLLVRDRLKSVLLSQSVFGTQY